MSLIVVIDAEPVVRTVVTQILERDGHEVHSAATFESGLAIVKALRPDLVVTNVLLPGITGHDAMCKLRDEFPDLRVLMVSGLPDHPAIQEWRKESGFDTFPKPFPAASLRAKVRETLEDGDRKQISLGG